MKVKMCGLDRPEDIAYANEAVSYTHLDVYKRQEGTQDRWRKSTSGISPGFGV